MSRIAISISVKSIQLRKARLLIIAFLLFLGACLPPEISRHLENAKKFSELQMFEETNIELTKALTILNKKMGGASSFEAMLLEGVILYKKRDFAGVINILEKAKKENPKIAVIYFLLGTSYCETEKYDKAIAELQECLKLNPNLIEAHHSLGVVYFKTKRYDKAIEKYKNVINKKPSKEIDFFSGNIFTFSAHYNLGLAYIKKEMYDKAIKSFKEVFKRTFNMKIKNEIDIAHYLKKIKSNPKDEISRLSLAKAYLDKEELDLAVIELKDILELNPENAHAFFYLGKIYLKKGFVDKAIEHYKKSTEIKHDFADAFFELGETYLKKKELIKAMETYEKTLLIEPRRQEARQSFTIADLEKNKKESNYYILGNYYFQKGWYDEAIKYYKEVLKVNPKSAKAHFNLGYTYYKSTKNYNKAIKEYKKAVDLNPDYYKARYNLGICYYDIGLNKKAIKEFTQTLKVFYKSSELHKNLGYAYYKTNKYSKAIAEWKKSLELSADEETKIKLAKLIEIIA